jgi:hypothetical protein
MRKKTFFVIGRMFYEVKNEDTMISYKKVQIQQVKRENMEYKQLRKIYNENRFLLFKLYDKWIVKEKD